jgi:hypothetical protein
MKRSEPSAAELTEIGRLFRAKLQYLEEQHPTGARWLALELPNWQERRGVFAPDPPSPHNGSRPKAQRNGST